MRRIPIVTSIPPRLSRKTVQGVDIGARYQEQCIDSWLKAGFAPVSVNCVSESVPFTDKVRVIRVRRTGAARFGKPLVLVSDLLRVASELGSGPVAITNADILLDPELDVLEAIGDLEPGRAVIARRIDIGTPNDRDGDLFLDGYDFFAAHPHNLRQLPNLSLAVGIPWWDHFLPMALHAKGVRVHLLTDPFVFHLKHDDRWNYEQWCEAGKDYFDRMHAFVLRTDRAHNYSCFLHDVSRRRPEIKTPSLLSRIRRRISPAYRARKLKKEKACTGPDLARFATGTVKFIEDRFSTQAAQLVRALNESRANQEHMGQLQAIDRRIAFRAGPEFS